MTSLIHGEVGEFFYAEGPREGASNLPTAGNSAQWQLKIVCSCSKKIN